MNNDHAQVEEIAIVGMAGRFPGADDLETFWHNIRSGVESITQFDAALLTGVSAETLAHPNYVKAGAVLSDVAQFDADFFGFTPRQAEITDPQHRLFIECAWQALEMAGHDASRDDAPVGVFAGMSMSTYFMSNLQSHLTLDTTTANLQFLVGNDKDYLATHTAYRLNLQGPCVSVQTACSTGLVAVHLAAQSLLNLECDVALAGAVTVKVPQEAGYYYQQGAIFSPDGDCRPFSAEAQGTVFGSGVGVVALKRLADARADGDPILAVIKGSAINNDGAQKVGFTAPGVDGQSRVIAEAMGVADIDPRTVSYVEAHGTGTPIGDPIEITALDSVYRPAAPVGNCAIGSLKSNIGHLETAAGIASLIKLVLMFQHRQLPPSLHFNTPNPSINFADSAFRVNTALADWQPIDGVRRAAVSSFGIGGTNAHIVLEEAPTDDPPAETPPVLLLTLSANCAPALTAQREQWADGLSAENAAALCYTARHGRANFAERLAVVGDSAESLQQQLRAGGGVVGTAAAPPRIAFLFSGQGSQYAGMGKQLYASEPTFRHWIDRCDALLQPLIGRSLVGLLDSAELNETAYTQPALFALEYALAQLWLSWGVAPDVVMGHSVGEYVAACLAGVFSLEDGLRLIAARGRLMQELPRTGSMAAVFADEETVQRAIGAADQVSIAAINGPENVVISGESGAVERISAELEARDIDVRELVVSHAFHSPLMRPMLDAFRDVAARVTYADPHIPFVSNVTGELVGRGVVNSAAYWVDHVLATVRFADGIAAVVTPNTFCLEIGPHSTLTAMGQRCVSHDRWAHALRRGQPDWTTLLTAVGAAFCHGVPVDWEAFDAASRQRIIPAPTYPFQRTRHWVEPLTKSPTAQPARAHLNGNGQLAESPANLTEAIALFREQMVFLERFADEPARQRVVEGEAVSAETVLINTIAEICGRSAALIPPTVPLQDLGFDSLMLNILRDKVLNRIPTLGDLPLRLLVTGSTVQQIAAHIEQATGRTTAPQGNAKSLYDYDIPAAALAQFAAWSADFTPGDIRRIERKWVHKDYEENVLIARTTLLDEATILAEITQDIDHTFFYEHPKDHVTSLYLIEAAQQLSRAAPHIHLGVPLGDVFTIDDMEVRFHTFAETDRPLFMVAVISDAVYDEAGVLRHLRSDGYFVQDGQMIGVVRGSGRFYRVNDYVSLRFEAVASNACK